jgi:hypothetical protein
VTRVSRFEEVKCARGDQTVGFPENLELDLFHPDFAGYAVKIRDCGAEISELAVGKLVLPRFDIRDFPAHILAGKD